MSDIAVEGSADKVAELQAQLVEAQAERDALANDPTAQLQAQLAEVRAELTATREQLAQAQTAPQAAAEALVAHVAPSRAQAVLDAVQAGEAVTSVDLAAAKDEVQHYLDTAGPMKALVDAWEKLRQL
ncbi:MAG: hypothetical protein ACREES_00730 [Stellaceae bacterium]